MAHVPADCYRRWFQFEKDSHAKVLASLHSVPQERRGDAAFQKAVDVFAHIIGARQLWLYRLGVAREHKIELFPDGMPLEDLVARIDEVHAAWQAYFERLDDSEVSRVMKYRSYEGEPYRNIVDDVLTQMFGHSLYHRGQIASLVRAAGGTPAATDFIFWTRQEIAASELEKRS